MGIRFRKSINLGGGARVNLSKKGIGYSVGVKGARVTKTAKGTIRKTVTIPNTNISHVTESSGKSKSSGGSVAAAAASDKPYRLFAIVLRIASIVMIVLGALLALVFVGVGIASIVIGVLEWLLANRFKKKYKAQIESKEEL